MPTPLARDLSGPLALSAVALALFCARGAWADTVGFAYLPYNLVLAVIPLLLSSSILWVDRAWFALPVGAVWLLFLPNAPYVLTDLIHIGPVGPVPEVFDALMFGAFALASLDAGAVSLGHAHRWMARRLGGPPATLGTTVFGGLSGVGVWLGREHRHNSWDVATNPWPIVDDALAMVLDPTHHVDSWAVALGIAGVFLARTLSLGQGPEAAPGPLPGSPGPGSPPKSGHPQHHLTGRRPARLGRHV